VGSEYIEPKITRISVGGQPVGMRDLGQVFDNVSAQDIHSQDELERALLEEARIMKNHIAPSAEHSYRAALLREYRRHLGEPVHEDRQQGLIIRILGRGCPRCSHLAQEVMAVLSELRIGADVEHVTDINQIAEYGAVGTPALVINNEIKSTGRLPSRGQLKIWIEEQGGSV